VGIELKSGERGEKIAVQPPTPLDVVEQSSVVESTASIHVELGAPYIPWKTLNLRRFLDRRVQCVRSRSVRGCMIKLNKLDPTRLLLRLPAGYVVSLIPSAVIKSKR